MAQKKKKKKKQSYKKEVIITLSVLIALPSISYGIYQYMNYVTSRDWYEKAENFLEKGQILNAEKCVHNALLYDNEYSDAYLLKAQLVIGDAPKVYDYGVELVTKAMKYADEPSMEMYYVRGKCHYHLNNYSMAQKDLEKSLEFENTVDSTHYFLGQIYSEQQGKEAKANRHLKKFRKAGS